MTEAAAVVGTLGVVLAVAGRTRALVLAGLAAIGIAELLLARTLFAGEVGSTLASPAAIVLACVALPALGAAAWIFVRHPAIVPAVVVAAAPLRFPFELGTEHRFFVALGESGALGRLIPLYAVLAAAALALAWRLVRGEEAAAPPSFLAVPAALLLGLMVLSLLWAYDLTAAEDRVAFFILPFAALTAIVLRAPFRPWLPRALAIVAIALACLFAAVGLAEAWVRELLFYDPKVAVANEYTSYFRVTSLFSDPSIYGRHLALALVLVVVCLWLGRIGVVAGVALAAFVWAGLYFSYSQSSLVALAAAVVAVSFLVADRRTRRWIAGTAVALALVGSLALVTLLREESADRITSGRTTLASNTWTVFADNPLVGVGLASQPLATRDATDGPRRASRHVSHTTPLKVAAELGILGLAAYVAFLAGAALLVAEVRRRAEGLGLALLGVLVLLVTHSLFYDVFLEEPLMWSAVALGGSFLAAATAPERREPRAARRLPRLRRAATAER